MSGYRGRLTGPLSTAPEGLYEAVQRARGHRVVATGVCRSGHALVTVLDTSEGRVVLWNPSSAFIDLDDGARRFTGAEWVQTIEQSGTPGDLSGCRCRCSRVARVDVGALIELAASSSRARVRLA